MVFYKVVNNQLVALKILLAYFFSSTWLRGLNSGLSVDRGVFNCINTVHFTCSEVLTEAAVAWLVELVSVGVLRSSPTTLGSSLKLFPLRHCGWMITSCNEHGAACEVISASSLWAGAWNTQVRMLAHTYSLVTTASTLDSPRPSCQKGSRCANVNVSPQTNRMSKLYSLETQNSICDYLG